MKLMLNNLIVLYLISSLTFIFVFDETFIFIYVISVYL